MSEQELADQLEQTLAAYRDDPDEENRAAYRAANEKLAQDRQAARADRPASLTVVAEG